MDDSFKSGTTSDGTRLSTKSPIYTTNAINEFDSSKPSSFGPESVYSKAQLWCGVT